MKPRLRGVAQQRIQRDRSTPENFFSLVKLEFHEPLLSSKSQKRSRSGGLRFDHRPSSSSLGCASDQLGRLFFHTLSFAVGSMRSRRRMKGTPLAVLLVWLFRTVKSPAALLS